MDNKYNPYSLIGYAIYCVAPELLKPNREPPQMPLLYAIEKKRNEEALKMLKEKLKEKKKEERKGCLLLIIFLLSILFIAAIKIKLLF